MFEHILIPTDGSDPSEDAVQYGISLAKDANAKVTGITVSTPFHVLAVDPATLTDTPESFKKRMTDRRNEVPRTGEGRRSGSRCKLLYSPCRARASFPSYYRCGEDKRVRFDRDGLPRAPRDLCDCPG